MFTTVWGCHHDALSSNMDHPALPSQFASPQYIYIAEVADEEEEGWCLRDDLNDNELE